MTNYRVPLRFRGFQTILAENHTLPHDQTTFYHFRPIARRNDGRVQPAQKPRAY